MDWMEVIEANRARLLRLLAPLLAAAGLAGGAGAATLPRHVRSNILRLLRPAESATRRLIYIWAQGIEGAEPEPRSGDNATARPKAGAFRPCPDGRLQGKSKNPLSRPSGTKAGTSLNRAQAKGGPASGAGQQRAPAFPLIDPRKRFFDQRPKRIKGPGPRVRGLFDDWAPSPPPPAPPSPDDPVSAKRLCQRLQALQAALEDIPGQARRMARIMARRAKAPPGPGCVPPLRPGYPPGYRKRGLYQVDQVLRDCHWFAMYTHEVTVPVLKEEPPPHGHR